MSQPYKKHTISGWGNYPLLHTLSYRPEKKSDVIDIVEQHSSCLIARGMGRSYGDASLSQDGTLLLERLDYFLAFDTKEGIITTQSGTTLADILKIALPKGWILPVIPGTKFISVGGAIASNVHGKNHYKNGNFADHLLNLTLLLPDGNTLNCSSTENSDIFWATAGGMGMTGIILEATIKLQPITSLHLTTQTKKVGNIHEMIEAFNGAKDTHEYMIGWIDHFSKGNKIGRGVFEKANHISPGQGGASPIEYQPPKQGISIPKWFPSIVLNKYSMAIYNQLRFAKFSYQWKEHIVNFDGFFHPLDNLQHWNRLYGKKGFFQYQFVLPDTDKVADHLQNILSFIQEKDEFSFLAVLKYHQEHRGLLSFPIKGYSLALDFPNTPSIHQLQHELNRLVCDLGGRIYLAKDALLSAELFKKMYQDHLPKWRQIINTIDPTKKFESAMSQRLRFKGENK